MATIHYGVFLVGRAWKFYSETERAMDFISRDEAITAANGAVRDAIANGRQIELYIQDADGDFVRTNPATIAH